MPLGILKNIFYSLLIILSLNAQAKATDKSIVVRVGGYDFAPFVEKEGSEGVVRELIAKLNNTQKKYHFEFVYTSPNRRYKDFKLRKFDMIFFEDESWGWKDRKINYARTGILTQGEEMAIALKYDRDQSYFDNLDKKKVRIILGFHYQFTDMKTDQDRILKKGIEQGRNYHENVMDLLDKKIDVTYVNSLYLKRIFELDKELKEKILVAPKPDHSFVLRGLIHPSSPITVSELEKLGLNKMVED